MSNKITGANMAADIAASASAGLASVTWLANLNTVLQLVATVVAIIAGIAAAWWHFERAILARAERIRCRNFDE